jgi:integrase
VAGPVTVGIQTRGDCAQGETAPLEGVAGHSESAIQKQLGHASAASTRRYRHVVDQEMIAVAATMDRLVGGKQ